MKRSLEEKEGQEGLEHFWLEGQKDAVFIKCDGEGFGRSRVFRGREDQEFGFTCEVNIYYSFFKFTIYYINRCW